MLNLVKNRPIVFLDLETTGLNLLNDRIVELSIVRISPDGSREVKTRLLNPGIPIPEESSAIHGIKDEDVKDAPSFRAISKNLFIYLEDCDLAGYNIVKFDIPMLTREFSRAGLQFSTAGRKIIDAYHIFCRMEPRNLSAAYQFFCGKKMVDAHSAESDTLATIEILEGQIKKYSALPKERLPDDVESFPDTLDGLHEFCSQRNSDHIDPEGRFKWKNGEPVVAFGRHAGTPVKTLALESPDFFRWMLRGDFSMEAKEIAQNALRGVFPEKK